MANEFLKSLSGLIEKPEIQSALKMLGGQQPTASVSENLTVPFGLTFDQGQKLRETAAGIDDSRARANAEAQRIAIENRESETRQKATEHAIKNADITDLESKALDQNHEIAMADYEGQIRAELNVQDAKNQLAVNRQNTEDQIALRRVDYEMENDPSSISYMQAMSQIAVDQARIVSDEALAASRQHGILKAELKAAGVPDVEARATMYQNWVAGEERIRQRLTTGDPGYEIAPDPESLQRSLTSYWIDGYMLGAVDATALGKWLPADEFAEVLRLEQVRARGNPQEIAAERDKFKRDWEDNFSLDRSIPDDSMLSQPIDLEVNETQMESQAPESLGRTRTQGEQSPRREERAKGGEAARRAEKRRSFAEGVKAKQPDERKNIDLPISPFRLTP